MKNIIILGAGFGGLRVAIELAQRRDKLQDYKIILVDKNLHHTFTPLVYEVATGYYQHESWRSDLALSHGAEITVSKIIETACKDCIELVVGQVTRIDKIAKKIIINRERELDYEYLVLALGAESDFFGIPGLPENSIPLKSLDDAVLIRHKIGDFIENKALRKSVQLQVLIGGGGSTGVEFGAELAYFFRHVVRDKNLQHGDYDITLIEAGSRLIPFAPQDGSRLAYDRLSKLGVKVLLDTCIKKVVDAGSELVVTPRPLKLGENPDALLCSMAPGEEKKFSYDLLVWAGGIRGAALLKESGFNVDAKGRVAIDEYCALKEMTGVFALGDCAVFTDQASGKPAPWLAQTAIEQGYILASKILNEIAGLPRHSYKMHPYPTVLPMGGKNALFVYKNFYANGFWGWLLHEAAALRYFVSVLRLKEGLKLWLKGAWAYSKND